MTAKYEVIIDSNWEKHHEFPRWHFSTFFKATNVDIKFQELDLNTKFQQLRAKSNHRDIKFGDLSFFKFNGKLVALDCWAHYKYLDPMQKAGFFNNLKVDLWLKQHENAHITKLLGYKTACWIMFPGGKKFTNSFRWENKAHKYLTMFTSGKNSMRTMHRYQWHDYCRTHPTQFFCYGFNNLPEDQFEQILKECKFGLCVSHWQYKNTREHEFISNHIPMALNYCPPYDYEFKPGKHFLHLQKPEDLALLATTDPIPFHLASKQLWDDYYEPNAAMRFLDYLINR